LGVDLLGMVEGDPASLPLVISPGSKPFKFPHTPAYTHTVQRQHVFFGICWLLKHIKTEYHPKMGMAKWGVRTI